MITSNIIYEYEPHRFSVDATALGWGPGQWPHALPAVRCYSSAWRSATMIYCGSIIFRTTAACGFGSTTIKTEDRATKH